MSANQQDAIDMDELDVMLKRKLQISKETDLLFLKKSFDTVLTNFVILNMVVGRVHKEYKLTANEMAEFKTDIRSAEQILEMLLKKLEIVVINDAGKSVTIDL
jgi:hypothetical protein